MLMSGSDKMTGDDPEFEQFADEYERHRNVFFQLISDFMEEEELGETYVAELLMDITIRMRMAAYGGGVEQPSVAGLKLDLDRFRRELDEGVRAAKKDAEAFIEEAKRVRKALEAEQEPE